MTFVARLKNFRLHSKKSTPDLREPRVPLEANAPVRMFSPNSSFEPIFSPLSLPDVPLPAAAAASCPGEEATRQWAMSHSGTGLGIHELPALPKPYFQMPQPTMLVMPPLEDGEGEGDVDHLMPSSRSYANFSDSDATSESSHSMSRSSSGLSSSDSAWDSGSCTSYEDEPSPRKPPVPQAMAPYPCKTAPYHLQDSDSAYDGIAADSPTSQSSAYGGIVTDSPASPYGGIITESPSYDSEATTSESAYSLPSLSLPSDDSILQQITLRLEGMGIKPANASQLGALAKLASLPKRSSSLSSTSISSAPSTNPNPTETVFSPRLSSSPHPETAAEFDVPTLCVLPPTPVATLASPRCIDIHIDVDVPVVELPFFGAENPRFSLDFGGDLAGGMPFPEQHGFGFGMGAFGECECEEGEIGIAL